jgi:hypothetical protein
MTGSACPVNVTADFIKFLRTLGSLDASSRDAVMAVVQKKGTIQIIRDARGVGGGRGLAKMSRDNFYW